MPEIERTLSEISTFERQLSEFVGDSGLSVHDAIIAIGICMARVLYGLEALQGKDSAIEACQLLDRTMVRAWEDFTSKPRVVN